MSGLCWVWNGRMWGFGLLFGCVPVLARLKSHVLLVVGYAVWGASDVYAEEVTELEPVIVYGSYDVDTPFAVTGHAPQWSVQSVDMITASDTEAIAADRIEDFADTLPGVLLGRTQAGIASNVWLRGFSLQGRLHLDGVPDNRRYMLRDPATMERVEVIKGLDSVLFGSGSPGGMVNYVSKKPDFRHIRKLTVGGGSPLRSRLVVDVGDALGDATQDSDWAWRTVVVAQNAETGRKNVGDDRVVVMPSLLFENDQHELLLQAEFNRQNRDFDFDNVFVNGKPVYDVSYTDPRTDSSRTSHRLSVQYLGKLGGNWTGRLDTSFIQGKRKEKLIGFWQLNADQQTLEGFYRKVNDDYQQWAVRGELQHFSGSASGTAQHKTRLGVDLFRLDSEVKSAHEIGGFTLDVFNPVFDFALPNDAALTRRDKRTVDDEQAVYLHHEIKLGNQWLVTGGVRTSRFTAKTLPAGEQAIRISNQKTVSSLGTSWQFKPGWTAFANRTESFSPNSGRDQQERPFAPKSGLQYELGLRHQRGKKGWRFEGSVYRIDQQNLLTRDPDNTAFRIPLGEVRVQGVELSSFLPVNDRLSLNTGLTWYDAQITQNNDGNVGHRLHSVPRFSGSLKLDYQLPDKLRLNIGAVHIGERMGDNANSFQLPAYTRWDAGVQWQLGKQTDLRLAVRNLTDENYVATGGGADFLVVGRDRTTVLDVSWLF